MAERTIQDIVETLRHSGAEPRRCTVLIGAGCSRSAGIPLASEIVTEIQTSYPAAYSRATVKDYPNCMAALEMGVRRDLIARYVDRAKLNWAHIALAQLIHNGFVDRVLTTNFDPLVSRASALVNIFPAVYDLATSRVFKPDQVSQKSIFHLHGQRDGFVLLNTDTEFRVHRKHLRPVFEDAHRGRVWIIVGYSGENDPVFDLLTKISQFEYGLYWIGLNNSPPKHVSDHLLGPRKGAHYIGNFDADDFFVLLARKLGCFPPTFIRQPYSYLKHILSGLSEYKAPSENGRFDVTANIRKGLEAAITEQESTLTAEYHFLAGEYDQVVTLLRRTILGDLTNRERHLLAWASLMQGNGIADRARELESEKLYREAAAKFRYATRIEPRLYEAFYNWGNALFDLSLLRRHGAPEVMTAGAYKLLEGAVSKYEAAVSINPRDADVHNNWGNALCDLARASPPSEEPRRLKEAFKHYKRAAQGTENLDLIYNNWAKAMHDYARVTRGAEAERAHIRALDYFAIAAEHNSDNYSVFLSWANALSDRGRLSGQHKYFEEAFVKYRHALKIQPGDKAVLWNWAGDLTRLAELRKGAVRTRLLREAKSKREQARKADLV